MADGERDREQHRLGREDAAGLVPGIRVGRAEGTEETTHELEPGDAQRVARELAAHGVARDRIPLVHRDVGLVRPELLAVVRHVATPVQVDRDERGVGEQPASDPVVHPAVREQQPVGGLVLEDVELHVGATHEEERENPRDRVVQPHRGHEHPDRLDPDERDRPHVRPRRDVAQVLAERRCRSAIGADAVAGRLDEQFRVGSHGHGRHVVYVTRVAQAQRTRKVRDGDSALATPVALLGRPLGARSVMASLLLGMDPPRIRGALLVRWCGLFDIAEGTARVALSRMVANGELTTTGGFYELAGGLREPSARAGVEPRAAPARVARCVADGGSRTRGPHRGRTPVAARRDAPPEVRGGAGGTLGPSGQPPRCRDAGPGAGHRRRAVPVVDGSTRVRAGCARRAAVRPDHLGDARGVLVAELADVTRRLEGGVSGLEADAFLAGAAALVHVRADPLLPAELLPPVWPGEAPCARSTRGTGPNSERRPRVVPSQPRLNLV